MRIAITGGAGFIGSNLGERLAKRGDEVILIDNFDDFYDPAIKRANIRQAIRLGARVRECDIADPTLCSYFTGCETLLHLAARPGVRRSFEAPDAYVDTNVTGTTKVLMAARTANIRKVIFASSSSVYGEGVEPPFSEAMHLGTPASPYASTKVAAEHLCANLRTDFDEMVILRFFTAYGPRQRPDLAVHKFARMILNREAIPVFGATISYRDYTYIDDVCSGITSALDTAVRFEILNLGSGIPVTLDALISHLEIALGIEARRKTLPSQKGDLFGTLADISKAEALLAYAPRWSLQEGLKEFVAWLRP